LDIEKLFLKAKTGNAEAEKELFAILLVRFRLIASQLIGNWDVAQDVAHDAATSALLAYRKLEVHTSFTAWAHSIIRRQALHYIGKRKREKEIIREMGEKIGSNSYYEISPVMELKVMDCLKKLSQSDKVYVRILNLKHLGFTFEEICAKLNITSNNAYVLLHRARKAMAHCLEKGEKK